MHGYFFQINKPYTGIMMADSNLTRLHATAFDNEEEED
jgi:hypothetical protein